MLLLIPAAYWLSLLQAMRHRFLSRGWNTATIWSGVVLLSPLVVGAGCLIWWNYMVSDWPMNIGGKPNMTLYHNIREPLWAGVFGYVFPVFVALAWLAVLPTWVYAMVRIRRVARSGRPTPP